MTQYIIRRILLAFPAMLFVVTLVFFLLRVAPGDITDTLFLDANPNPEQKQRLIRELGLDKPIYIQYLDWLWKTAQFDLGYSLMKNKPVVESIKEALPNSLRLGAMSLLISWIIAIPIGVLAAVKQDTWLDYVARGWAILLLAVPNFFLAVLVLILPAIYLGWAPPLAPPPFSMDPIANVLGFITPALVIGVQLTGTLMRMTRAMMLEVLRADYIRTARAKGLSERAVIVRHALKNALIPVVTILGAQLSFIIGGAVIIENIFGIAGMGRLIFQGVISKDIAIVQAVTVLFATFILTMNLIVDVSYAWLDPRIKYQ